MYLLGLDLGQRDDYTALAVLQVDREHDDLTLKRLERARGKPYTEIAKMVKNVMTALQPAEARLVVVFEQHKLRIPRFMRHGGTLEREALAFQMKLSASGHDTYSARSGEYDDLLLAVSMPVWWRRNRRAGV